MQITLVYARETALPQPPENSTTRLPRLRQSAKLFCFRFTTCVTIFAAVYPSIRSSSDLPHALLSFYDLIFIQNNTRAEYHFFMIPCARILVAIALPSCDAVTR